MSAVVQPLHEAAIRQYARQLRLPTVGGQFARSAEQAVKEKQTHLSYLEALLKGEVEERDRKAAGSAIGKRGCMCFAAKTARRRSGAPWRSARPGRVWGGRHWPP